MVRQLSARAPEGALRRVQAKLGSRACARALTVALSLLVLLFVASPPHVFSESDGSSRNVEVVRFMVHGQRDREPAVAVWPRGKAAKSERLPLVIAFHGKGEQKLGVERGYRAWVERYALVPAYEALLGGVLVREAFGGLVRDAELAALNADLAARAFKGVLVVGVFTPDLMAEVDHPERIDAYAAWVAEKLVPKAQRMFPVLSQEPRSVGVDGVSLGGMVALEVGLRHPEVFSAVGTMQPAIRGREAELATRAEQAQRRFPQTLRLLSSDHDPLLDTTRKLSDELRKRHVAHTLEVTPGAHDYAFNQGPGAIQLLYFHDRALRH